MCQIREIAEIFATQVYFVSQLMELANANKMIRGKCAKFAHSSSCKFGACTIYAWQKDLSNDNSKHIDIELLNYQSCNNSILKLQRYKWCFYKKHLKDWQ